MFDELPFIGDWARERSLGSGGFGTVILWKNKKTNEAVAVKKCNLLTQNDTITERQKERWQYEVQLMTTKIDCTNVVKTINIDAWAAFKEGLNKVNPSGLPILVMEYCEGGDLRRQLNKKSNCNGLPQREVRDVLKALRNAISYLHDMKITHRDIKPENIVLKQQAKDSYIYKITDLGYAKQLDRQSLQASLVGTMEYLAPELLHSDKYSCSVDYWSLGIISFEICCGCRPFLPHASMARWMLTVKNKKSQHIAITEENTEGVYTYHTELFPETKLSSTFKQMLQCWLTLALEWNPKQRGYVFEMKGAASNIDVTNEQIPQSLKNMSLRKGQPGGTAGPVQTLKIFSFLDELLNRKILIAFDLFNCTFVSFEIKDPNQTVADLRSKVPGLSGGEVEFILPCSHPTLDSIQEQTKLIDVCVEDDFEKPMLFIARRGHLLRRNIKPDIPKLVVDVFENPAQSLKTHIVKQFANNAYFFLRNEQRLYATALDGIKNYSLQVNHEVTMHKARIFPMMELIFEMKGAVQFFVRNLHVATRNGLIVQDILPASLKLGDNVLKLVEAIKKIKTRYDSVLKRSVDVVKHNLFETEPKEFFQATALNDQMDLVRHELMEKKVTDKTHTGLVKLLYNSLKERDSALGDPVFLHLQQFLLDLKKESEEIFKTVEMAILQTRKYKAELACLNDQYQVMLKELVKGGDIPKVIDFRVGDEVRLNSAMRMEGATSESALKVSATECASDVETKSLIDENHTLLDALGVLLGLVPSSEL